MNQLSTYPARFWVAAAAILATFVGLFGPWAKAVFVSISGLDTDDGKVIAVMAAVAALMLVIHASQTNLAPPPLWPLVVMLLCGVGITAASLYDRSDIADRVADAEGLATVGWGIYFDITGGAALIIASLILVGGRNEAYGKRLSHHAAMPLPPEPPHMQPPAPTVDNEVAAEPTALAPVGVQMAAPPQMPPAPTPPGSPSEGADRATPPRTEASAHTGEAELGSNAARVAASDPDDGTVRTATGGRGER